MPLVWEINCEEAFICNDVCCCLNYFDACFVEVVIDVGGGEKIICKLLKKQVYIS